MSASDETVNRRIDETRQLIVKVDLSLAILTLASLVLAVVLLAVFADQWLFADGLSHVLRLGVFALLSFLGIFFIYRRIIPLFTRSINPVYAANILEENVPTLKNSLVNWILLRRERQEYGTDSEDKLTERIYDGVAQSAASGVEQIPSEQAVDLRGLAWRGIIFAVLVLCLMVYAALSPKNPLQSFARIVLPWSNIAPAQAIQFKDIKPGNAVAQQGEHLTVSAEVIAQKKLETPVYVVFSSDDGQMAEQRVPMSVAKNAKPSGGLRLEVPFPPGKQGFTSSVEYYLQCEDSKSGIYRIDVKPVASLEIVSVKYTYPAYTGLKEEIVENNNDIRAVDGTMAEIRVRSTLPVQQVELLFDDAPKQPLKMRLAADSMGASAELPLKLDENSQTPTTVRRFSFRALDRDGFESRRSGVFQWEVLPDKPPLIHWADTDEKLKELAHIDLPLNGSLDLPIQAEDPDFALRYINFYMEPADKRIRLYSEKLLDSPATGPTPHKGPISVKTVFSPTKCKLNEGNTAEIWAEAVDTKFPNPNNATTRRITVRITAPQQQEPKQEEKKPDKQQNEQDSQKPADEPQNGEQKEKEQNQEENGENSEDAENKPNEESNEKDGNENEDNSAEQNGEKKSQPNEQEQNSQGQQNGQDSANPQPNEPDSANSAKEQSQQNDEKGQQNGQDSANPQPNEPDSANSAKEQGQQDGEKGQQNGQGSANPQPNEPDSANPAEEQSQQNGEKGQSINPETNPGDAMEKIIEQMNKDGKMPEQGTDEGQGQQNEQEQNGQNKPEPANPAEGQGQQNEQEQNGQNKPEPANPAEGQGQQNEQGQSGQSEPGSANPDSTEEQGTEQPVAQDDSTQRERNDSLDPNSQQQRSDGGDSSNPKESTSGQSGQNGQESANPTEGQGQQSKPDSANPAEGQGQQSESDSANPAEGQGQQSEPGSANPAEGQGQQSEPGSANPAEGQGQQNEQDSANPTEGQGQQGEQDSANPAEGQGQQGEPGSANPAEGQGQQSESGSANPAEGQGQQGEPGSANPTEGQGQQGEPGSANPAEGQGQQSEPGSANPTEGQGQQGEQGSANPAEGQGQQGEQGSANPAEGQGQQNGQDSANPAEGQGQQGQNSQQSGQNSGAPSGGTGGGGGKGVDTKTEDANLEYTEKVTNLVLEYLEEQLKEKPSQELLDKLGWTQEDLEQFYARWKKMSDERQSSPEATDDEEKWKEALKSLGLRPARSKETLRQSQSQDDTETATESRRYAPPKILEKRFQQYTEGISGGTR